MDDDLPLLTLSFRDPVVTENAVNPATQGTVTANVASPVQMTLLLHSDNPLVTVPPSVILASNQTSIAFPVNVVNDHLVHGSSVANITAFVADSVSGRALSQAGTARSLTLIDDNGPALTVSFAAGLIPETGSTTGTISCNTALATPLVVNLTSSDTTAATVPVTVTIPAGQTSTTFTVSGVNPGHPTGSRRVTITAAATAFATGLGTLSVSDVNIPDLIVSGINLPAVAIGATNVTFSYNVANAGLDAATNLWLDKIYYSTSPNGDNLHQIATIIHRDPLAIGQSYTNSVPFNLPTDPGQYYIIITTDASATVNEASYANNTLASTNALNLLPAYHATIQSDIAAAPTGTVIPLRGHAFSAANSSQPAAFVPVSIRILVKTTRRVYTATTDASGNFIYYYQPLSSEAGSYQIAADHPAVATDTIQGGFALYGMSFSDGGASQTMIPGATAIGQVTLQNLGDLPLTGLSAVVEGTTAQLGITVSLTNQLDASGNAVLSYQLTAGNVSTAYVIHSRIHVTSAEGAVAYYPLTASIIPPTANLVAIPTTLNASMVRGKQKIIEFDLANVGGAPSGPITMLLPSTPWLGAVSTTNLPSLDPGQTNRITLSLTPASDLPLDQYRGSIALVAQNSAANVPFVFRAVSDALGSIQVAVQDDYTFYVAGSPLVTNAAVTLTDPYTHAVVASAVTGQSGSVLFTNLPEGDYQLTATADKHSAFQSPVTIFADQTNQFAAFVTRQTVSYSWTVVPTTVQDSYQIVLQTTFETEVPIPVVTMDTPELMPLVIDGEDTQMEIKLSNHGLIAAQRVLLNLPTDDPTYEFQALATNLDSIPAMSSISVPVVVRLRPNVFTPAIAKSPFAKISAQGPTPKAGSNPTTFTGCRTQPKIGIKWGYVCGSDFHWHLMDADIIAIPVSHDCGQDIRSFFGSALGDFAKNNLNWKNILHWKSPLNPNLTLNVDPCALADVIASCSGDECAVTLVKTVCNVASGNVSGALKAALGWGNCICPTIPPLTWQPPPYDPNSSLPNLPQIGATEYPQGPPDTKPWETWDPKGWNFSPCTPGSTGSYTTSVNAATKTTVQSHVIFGKNQPAPVAKPQAQTTDPNAVCAQVRIHIDQQAVIARAAFLGTLEMDNGDPNSPLTGIQVLLDVQDMNQNPANDRFGITGPVLTGITATDGTGTLLGGATGSAKFTFVPTHSAAPTNAAQYKIGGTLQYTQNGSLVQVPLLPQQITVYPDPLLNLHYFQQRDVYADDPFTPQIEPSEPFDLGLMVINNGYGKAYDFTITSAQPKIVDNQKGLLINFSIIGTLVGNQPIKPTLTANLGQIDPGQAKVGVWELVSTLQGRFLDFSASFKHTDAFGNPGTSLIDTIVTHELVHTVKADRQGDDDVPDFLVNDIPDPDNLPDTVYLSNGTNEPVTVATNAVVDAAAGPGHMQVQLTATVTGGWNYLQLTNPGPDLVLYRVVRSDNKEMLMTNNVWVTDRSFPSSITGAIRQNLLHLFDWAGPGAYTLYYRSTNTTTPTIVSLAPDLGFNQNNPVSALNITFSEQVDTTTFRATNLVLSLNGGANLITSGVNLTWVSGTTYLINGLAPFNAADGNYQLTVNGSGLLDLWGNDAGSISASVGWARGNVAPVIQSLSTVSPNPRKTPVTSLTATFSKAINSATFDYHDIALTCNGGPNLINGDVTVTAQSTNLFVIGGLGPITGAEGNYVLTVNAAAVLDNGATPGFGSASTTWSMITTAPTIQSVQQVGSTPRNNSVRSLTVTFTRPIDQSTFNYRNLVLSRNGGPNLLDANVVITPLSATTFQIANLSAAQSQSGTYSLVAQATNVVDLVGNPGSGSTNVTWQISLEPPASPTNLGIAPDLGISATDGLTSTNVITLSGTVSDTNLTVQIYDQTLSADLGLGAVNGTNFTASLTFATAGTHRLRVTAIDQANNNSAPAYYDLFVDLIAPSGTLVPVGSTNYGPVSSIPVTFSKAINTNTLDASHFTVTFNGTNPFTPSLTYVSSNQFLLGNIYTYTTPLGTYQVTLDMTGVQDLAGNQTTNQVSISWVNASTNQMPVITNSPQSLILTNGNNGMFNVAVSGSGPFTYQWLFNGTNLDAGINGNHVIDTLVGAYGEFISTKGLVQDAAGNLYIADRWNNCIDKFDTNGVLTLFAGVGGNGNAGFSGDGDYATNAYVSGPTGLALDSAGNLYFSDIGNNRIRRVDTNGIITTVAGSGNGGFSGDGGPATNASMNGPYQVACDALGNVYFADSYNSCVRKVDTSGIITTVAGFGGYSGDYAGDGIPATNTTLNWVNGIAVDSSGNLYLSDAYNRRVHKVDTNGIITTVAGSGSQGFGGDGSAATNALMNEPTWLTLDSNGTLFVTDSGRIRKIDTNGIITTVSGDGVNGFRGDGQSAKNAEFWFPEGLLVDSNGNLLIADTGNSRVRKVFATDPWLPELDLRNVSTDDAGNYQVIVTGSGGSVTSSVVTLTVVSPPAIQTQPQSQSTVANGAATFSVIASGDAPLSYQWLFNGASIPSASLTNYTLNNVQSSNGGNYSVIITNAYGSVTSSVAMLTVLFPPSIVSQPQSVLLTNGGNASFSVTVTGTQPLGYQWWFNGSIIPGATLTNYTLSNVQSTNAGNYWVVITNAYGSVTSSVAALIVQFPPAIVSQPQSVQLTNGGNANFSVTVIGTQPLGYQWWFNGAIIPGATLTNYTLNNVQSTNAGNYWVVITNAYGSVTSSIALLANVLPPYILTQPQSLSQVYGSNATFTVSATGTPTLGYQWLFNGTRIPGASLTNYAIAAVQSSNAGNYSVIITNTYGSVTSSVATLQAAAILILTQPQNLILAAGSNGSFGVTVAGTPPFTYQWLFNGSPINSQWLIATVAGTGSGGYLGDGAAAVAAKLNGPETVVLDSHGNLYIADGANHRIRKVDTNGVITTVAGTLTNGYSGDSGPATNARLYYPSGVAVDTNGNLYIADSENHRIRKVNTSGVISTLAGTGTSGFSGDGGQGTSARLNYPTSLALDTSGNLYIADYGNNRVRKLSPGGIISTLAGNGVGGYSANGGPATAAKLAFPSGVFVDAAGTVYIADTYNQCVRKVATNGIITTVAGNGEYGYNGDGAAATNAQLNLPSGLAVDSGGNLYLADEYNHSIRKVDATGTISTIAGNGYYGYSGDGGLATDAELNYPSGLAIGATGEIFIADWGNHSIRKLSNPSLYSPTLSLTNVTIDNAGNYQVIVTGNGGSVTSSVATLTLSTNIPAVVPSAAAPHITSLALSAVDKKQARLQWSGAPGSTFVLQSATNLTAPIHWYNIGSAIADANGQCSFVITNSAGVPMQMFRLSQ